MFGDSGVLGFNLMSDHTSGTTFFCAWFPRGGNQIMSSILLVDKSDAVSSLTVQVQTKNQEDDDNSATNLGSNQTISLTVGAVTQWSAGADLDAASAGVRELVRYKYVLSSATANTLCAVHLRTLAPSWLTN